VWDSLLGGASQLLPIPLLDDLALGRVRRGMVEALCRQRGVSPTPAQRRVLTGAGRPWGPLGCLVGVFLYPLKKLFRKLFYFLAVKEAVDTFSRLFHHGYLLHAVLERGALGTGGQPDDGAVAAAAAAAAVHGTLAAVDTRPLERLVGGVFSGSGRMLRGTLRWLAARLGRRRLAAAEATGADAEALSREAPAAEALLDRLLAVLWGEADYRRHLEQQVAARLVPPSAPTSPPAAG
jgi:hypothetical protein